VFSIPRRIVLDAAGFSRPRIGNGPAVPERVSPGGGGALSTLVADAMIVRPKLHRDSVTVGELRGVFRDDHVHVALLVSGRRLVAVVEPADLEAGLDNGMPARAAGTLFPRTVEPTASLRSALAEMRHTGRRRLAVIGDGGDLLGLLCLKASGRGFCSDDDVDCRRRGRQRQGG
jgi:hypothetical protein